MTQYFPHFVFRVLALLLCGTGCCAAEWPQWRGPGSEGHAPASGKIPLHWDEATNVRYRTALPGRGWSSPVVAGSQVWMTTAHEIEATPEAIQERLKKNTGGEPVVLREKVSWHALCVDTESGQLVHDIFLFALDAPQWVHDLNSYASPTPILAHGRLYAHFGTYGTVCVDTSTGQVRWISQEHHVHHENGPGSSPLLYKNLLILTMDGSDHQFMAALDIDTGRTAWKTPRTGTLRSNGQLRKNYSTPLVVPHAGRDTLLTQGADWLYAYDPLTGEELWKMPYGKLGFSLSARPVTDGNFLYLCTGFSNSSLLAIDLRGEMPAIAWSYDRGVPTMTSPILVEGLLYVLSDKGGLLTCLEAATGAEVFRERIGGDSSASPLYAAGRLYFCTRQGETVVVAPGREFRILARNVIEGRIMSSLAPVGDALYLRSDKALYRIQVPTP